MKLLGKGLWGLTLSSCDSECSCKPLGTSCSPPSHRRGCTTSAGTRRKSPCQHPGRSACQPTGLFGCSLRFLKNFTEKKKNTFNVLSRIDLLPGLHEEPRVPNRPVSLFLRLHRARTARLATHSKVESPSRRLKIPNSTSREPAPAVHVSLMQSAGTPVFRFTCSSDQR